MRHREDRPPRGLLFLYRALLALSVLLALVLLGGTLYALVFHDPAAGPLIQSPAPSPDSVRTVPSPSPPPSPSPVEESIFTGIGRVRANTAAPGSAAVILSIAFPYSPGDRAFSEELASRVGDFREIIREYFASSPEEELRLRAEETIKEDLRQRYNALLRLGRIEVLYFNDFMIIE
jgi:flagellar basal body-associated protein FliL